MNYDKNITDLVDLQDFLVQDFKITGDWVILTCIPKHNYAVCPKCQNLCQEVHEKIFKQIRDVRIWNKKCYLEFDHRRFYCPYCQSTFMERLVSIREHSSYTTRFESYIHKICGESSVEFASRFEELGYDATEGIYLREVQRQLQKNENENNYVEVLGIDEISKKKGHKDFILILSDIKNGRVIEVLEDRKKETLENYFDKMSEELKSHIKTVSIDMWNPYRSVVKEKLPHAQIVADRFHVMKNLNDC
jgi:transposase